MPNALLNAVSNPQKATRLVSAFLFFCCVVGVFIIWLTKGDGAAKIPLLILGIVAIVLILTTVEKSYLCGIAIVIIGTVVAQEEFLLKVAHMFRGSPVPVEQYLTGYETKQVQSDQRLQATIAQQIEKIVGEKLSEQKKQEISEVITQARLADLATRTESTGASDYPLRKYVVGGEELARFIAEYEKTQILKTSITFLRELGLIKCTQIDDPRSCQVTDLGRQVSEFIENQKTKPLPLPPKPVQEDLPPPAPSQKPS
jgi:hypothetical protein